MFSRIHVRTRASTAAKSSPSSPVEVVRVIGLVVAVVPAKAVGGAGVGDVDVDAAKVAVELEDAEAVPHPGIVSPADSIGPVLCMYSSKASSSMASLTKSTPLVVAGAVVSSVEVAPSAEGPSSPQPSATTLQSDADSPRSAHDEVPEENQEPQSTGCNRHRHWTAHSRKRSRSG